jgi:hypothetical protein
MKSAMPVCSRDHRQPGAATSSAAIPKDSSTATM